MKETKRDEPVQTLKKRVKGLGREQQAEEEGQAELKILDTSICGCDFGVPCCPEDK